MLGRILDALISTLRGKIMSLVNMIKRFTSPVYLQSTVVARIRAFFTNHFTIKPRNKRDYFTVFVWMISKRLVFMLCIIAGVLGLYYITIVNPVMSLKVDGVRTYSYNSVPLRFVSGKVNIRAKSGYIAYTGNVQKGKVTGEGTLRSKNGNLIYEGHFDNNYYNGEGKLYYDTEALRYSGGFVNNIFEGTGTLFRKNGSVEYEGEFLHGQKNGQGILFGSNSKPVYTGRFANDEVVYTDLLDLMTAEISKVYTGVSQVYRDDNDFIVTMDDIDALYTVDSSVETLDDAISIDGIYVLKNVFDYQGKKYTSISELKDMLSDIEYEGNSNILLSEAVCVKKINQKRESQFEQISISEEEIYKNVFEVSDFDSDNSLYLYSFSSDGIRYTFFCADKYGRFDFYLIEKE